MSQWPIAFLAFLVVSPGLLAGQSGPARPDVILATTTSLQETGLLDSLVPRFFAATGYRLRAVAVGSGLALRMAERGEADVVLVHSPAAEDAFMRAGHGVSRTPIATNYFTIVGPPDDPAAVRSAAGVPDALRRIAAAGAVFVSRGDSSGTHARELALWREAGGRPAWPGYLESGQGQAATLLIAGERRGYALTDRASYSQLRAHLGLVPLRENETPLLNTYDVIEISARGRPRINVAGGRAFARFVTSDTVQSWMERFGAAESGAPLFVPAYPPALSRPR